MIVREKTVSRQDIDYKSRQNGYKNGEEGQDVTFPGWRIGSTDHLERRRSDESVAQTVSRAIYDRMTPVYSRWSMLDRLTGTAVELEMPTYEEKISTEL